MRIFLFSFLSTAIIIIITLSIFLACSKAASLLTFPSTSKQLAFRSSAPFLTFLPHNFHSAPYTFRFLHHLFYSSSSPRSVDFFFSFGLAARMKFDRHSHEHFDAGLCVGELNLLLGAKKLAFFHCCIFEHISEEMCEVEML